MRFCLIIMILAISANVGNSQCSPNGKCPTVVGPSIPYYVPAQSPVYYPPVVMPQGSTIIENKAPTQVKACPCSDGCTCGCNAGKDCVCGGNKNIEIKKIGAVPDWMTQGIKVSEKNPLDGKEVFQINETKCSKDRLLQTLNSNTLVDDSKLWRLVVVGNDANKRTEVVKALETDKELETWKGKLVTYSNTPNHWHMSGYVTSAGDPTIYIVTPQGKVLRKPFAWKDSKSLAMELTKADPSYKEPENSNPIVPNISNPLPNIVEGFKYWGWVLLSFVLLGYIVYTKQKEKAV